jgi:hypothetical protein
MPSLLAFLTAAEPLPTDDKALMIKYLSLSEAELQQFVPLLVGLSTLEKRYGKSESLVAGTKALSNLLINVRMESRHSDTINESRALWAIKTWIPWIPQAVIGLGGRDLGTMILVSYYEAVMIATHEYMPELSSALFLPKRGAVIGSTWAELKAMEAECHVRRADSAEIEQAMDLVAVPLVYAVRHRLELVRK